MTDRFNGWQPEAVEFYERLAADNRREFWLEHKAFWQEQVRLPFEMLDAEVRDEFGPLHHFRPNRDVRFSKDKSPYKTHHGAVTEGEGGAMYYVHLDAEGLFVATGYYQMARDQLDRFRRAIDDETTGSELEGLLASLPTTTEVGGSALKRAPKGYPADHPRVELLRHKGLTVSRRYAPAGWLATRGALKRIVDTWRLATPVNDWLDTNVGPSEDVPDEFR
ncbi:MAG: DUF2461 domain-containing protein [Actinomycetota bacterium]